MIETSRMSGTSSSTVRPGASRAAAISLSALFFAPVTADREYPPLRVTAAYTQRLEAACDAHNETLPKLASFILPGGTPAAALLHQARVVVRRAERSVWALLAEDAERTNAETARYLNRLSDLLFILARVANPDGDVLWEPGAHSGAHAQRAATDRPAD